MDRKTKSISASGPNAVGHKNVFTAVTTAVYDLFTKKEQIPPLSPDICIDGKTCLVTGANSGLGKAVAIQLAQRGGRVIMACRSGIPEAGEDVKRLSGNPNIEMMQVDLSDLKSIHHFCDQLKEKNIKLDIVISNAGLMPLNARKSPQGFELMFAVHFMANRLMVERWLKDGVINPAKKGESAPRIVFVSSEAHQSSEPIDFQTFGEFVDFGLKDGLKHYAYTKLHLCTFAQELSRRTNPSEQTEIAVHSLCPGPIASNIARESPAFIKPLLAPIMKLLFRTPEQAAEPVIYLACSPEMGQRTGAYFHMMREKTASPLATDTQNGTELWQKSEVLLNESYS